MFMQGTCCLANFCLWAIATHNEPSIRMEYSWTPGQVTQTDAKHGGIKIEWVIMLKVCWRLTYLTKLSENSVPSSCLLFTFSLFKKKKKEKKLPEVPQDRTDGKMFLLIFFSGFKEFSGCRVNHKHALVVWRHSLSAEHELAISSQMLFIVIRASLAILSVMV